MGSIQSIINQRKNVQKIAFVNHSHLNNEGVLKDISYDILFEDGDRIEDVLENDLRVGANKKMNITEGAVFSIVDHLILLFHPFLCQEK